jgi:cytochrome b561
MFTLLPLAWVMVNMPTAANRELIYTLHKSLGLTVLALVAVRLILRAVHPAPQLPGS